MDTLRSVCYQLKERVPELGTILSEVEAIVPKIVVVGAQSAGKSSLLNRLLPDFLSVGGPGTEPLFSLPTSAGTCTKFPVTLSFIVTETPYIKLRENPARRHRVVRQRRRQQPGRHPVRG